MNQKTGTHRSTLFYRLMPVFFHVIDANGYILCKISPKHIKSQAHISANILHYARKTHVVIDVIPAK